ncbi:MAG: acylphosphatase [Candidatus Nezhaarchaeales archaeon]
MRLIRARILAEGRVQRVGYRDLVQSIARRLGVKGYVENLKDGSVQIVCEAEEGVLENFVKEIKVKEDFIEVEEVKIIEKSEATGEFEYFEIKYGRLEEELGERMGTAIEYAKAMRSDIRNMHKDLKEDLGGLKEDLGGLRTELRDMHKDLKEDLSGLRGDIRNMHKDLKEDLGGLRVDVQNMRKDLKDEVAGVRGEVREMRVDMNRSFEEMAKRYDAISSELVRTREELTRTVNGLLKLIEEFIRERRNANRTESKGS